MKQIRLKTFLSLCYIKSYIIIMNVRIILIIKNKWLPQSTSQIQIRYILKPVYFGSIRRT